MGNVKVLRASAGSGKTYRLAWEWVRAVIEWPESYRHILAVTFTNKATAEMKARIIKEIDLLARGAESQYAGDIKAQLKLDAEEIKRRAERVRSGILHDYSRFAVMTIDNFFQRIIRSFVYELGLDVNFTLELRTESILSRASDKLIDEISLDEQLRRWIEALVEEMIEEGKKWNVKSGLTSIGRHLFSENSRSFSGDDRKEQLSAIVEATRREAAKAKDAIRRDAQEALAVIQSAGLAAEDFAGRSRSFVHYLLEVAGGDVKEPPKAFTNVAEGGAMHTGKSPHTGAILAIEGQLRPLVERIQRTYNDNSRLFSSLVLLRENYRNFALLSDLRRKMEEVCRDEGILPISESGDIITRLISGNEAPFIYEKAGARFDRFMIDEFQDTSQRQWENFLPLLKNAVAQSPADPVLLVGDVKQSIYRWRGGDWRILSREIEKEFRGILPENLDTNYRSFGNVVEFNNDLIARCVEIDDRRLNDELDGAVREGRIGEGEGEELRGLLGAAYEGHRQLSVKAPGKGYVTVVGYRREAERPEELHPVVSMVEELQDRGFRPDEIAILVRVKKDGYNVADLLMERKRNNPDSGYSYDVVTEEALRIDNSPVTGFILACMKLSYERRDTISLAIYNRWNGRPVAAPLPPVDEEFFDRLSTRPPAEAFEHIQERFRLNEKKEYVAYIQALHDKVLEFGRSHIGDTQLFVKWWEENGGDISISLPSTASAISVMTIHKAKGLQFPAVVIPYCDWNLDPDSRNVVWTTGGGELSGAGVIPVNYKKEMAGSHFAADYYREKTLSHIDNMNILYVALTRAVEELHIMIPESRRSANRIGSLIQKAVAAKNGGISGGGSEGGQGGGQDCGPEGGPDCGQEGGPEGETADSHETVSCLYRFGSPVTRKPAGGDGSDVLYPDYASYPTASRLRLRLNRQRYYEDGGAENTASSRRYGILMHRAFESAVNAEQIAANISAMAEDGDISKEEVAGLQKTIGKAMEDPLINSWFTDDWSEVRNENEIIIPGAGSTRRPDRVMAGGGRAVVVDYKFGAAVSPSHARQVAEYGELMRRMGYAQVEGYVWYVTLEKVEKII